MNRTGLRIDTSLLAMLLMLSIATTMPAAASDYTLEIFGNANEDETINIQDVTYTELIILEYKDKTELADAKYGGEIDVLDMTQIALIVLEQENELTVKDAIDRIVTIDQLTERVVTLFPAATEMVYAFELNNLVGVDDESHADERFDHLTAVGDGCNPDYSTIIGLNPDLVITIMCDGYVHPDTITSNLGGEIPVVCIRVDTPMDSKENIVNAFNLLGWIFHETECIGDLIDNWSGDDGDLEVGVEWVTEYTWPCSDLPNSDDSAIAFYTRLGGAGWTQKFNNGNDDAEEEHFEYDGLDYTYIDGVDIAWYQGHGENTKLMLSTVWEHVHFQDEIEWGDSDLEWIALHSCNSTEIPENFKGSPYDLNGVHLICGFATKAFNYAADGDNFAEKLLEGKTVKDAWFEAIDKTHGTGTTLKVIGENEDCENDHIWGQGSVIADPPVDEYYSEWTHECTDNS